MAELEQPQATRRAGEEPDETASANELISEEELFAALDAGLLPPAIAAQLAQSKPVDGNGFEFSTAASGILPEVA
jgi:hypothetical protein